MATDPTSRACLLVRFARCITGRGRLDPDAVLDVDQLLGVGLAFGADEDVARVIATSPRPLTHCTDDAGSRHDSIFARYGRPVSGKPRGIAPAEDERDATESPDADERIMRGMNVGERARSPGEQRTEPAFWLHR
jgi:hypothetical protein